MTEELDDEKRTWYLKGYAQAEADQEVLIKKLMKDISDLSAERNGLWDDLEEVRNGLPWRISQEHVAENDKLTIEVDELKQQLKEAIWLLENPDTPRFDQRLMFLKGVIK